MLKHSFAAAIIMGVAATAPPAHAQSACATRDAITMGLADKYGETHVGGGLQSETKMVEVWMSETTGSFTILLTTPDGRSCIVSSGNNWTTFAPEPMPVGTPS